MPVLDKLIYSADRKGPWQLYIYETNGFHRGGVWFARFPKYPEEISVAEALCRAMRALGQRREVRVCDGGDELVYRAESGHVVYGATFWDDVFAERANA